LRIEFANAATHKKKKIKKKFKKTTKKITKRHSTIDGDLSDFSPSRRALGDPERVARFVTRELAAMGLGSAEATAEVTKYMAAVLASTPLPLCAPELAQVLPEEITSPYPFSVSGPLFVCCEDVACLKQTKRKLHMCTLTCIVASDKVDEI
jgi:hypothetical protein